MGQTFCFEEFFSKLVLVEASSCNFMWFQVLVTGKENNLILPSKKFRGIITFKKFNLLSLA